MTDHQEASTPWRDPARAQAILSTEHWSLLAARSLSWSETFSRAGLYLTILSASVVALALVAQATSFGDEFLLFALVLLSVVFFIGVTTVVRIEQAGLEDTRWMVGMNRIRAAYLDLEPRLADYLVTSAHDDEHGVLLSIGVPPGTRTSAGHVLVTTPGMLAVVNSVVGAAVAGVAVTALDGPTWLVVAAALVVFVLSLGVLLLSALRAFDLMRRTHVPRFPSPEGSSPV